MCWEHPWFCWVCFNYCYLCVNTPRACWNHWAGKLPGRLLLLSAVFKVAHDCYFPASLPASAPGVYQDRPRVPRAGQDGAAAAEGRDRGWGGFGNAPGAGQSWPCPTEVTVDNMFTSAPSHPAAPGEPGRRWVLYSSLDLGFSPCPASPRATGISNTCCAHIPTPALNLSPGRCHRALLSPQSHSLSPLQEAPVCPHPCPLSCVPQGWSPSQVAPGRCWCPLARDPGASQAFPRVPGHAQSTPTAAGGKC